MIDIVALKDTNRTLDEIEKRQLLFANLLSEAGVSSIDEIKSRRTRTDASRRIAELDSNGDFVRSSAHIIQEALNEKANYQLICTFMLRELFTRTDLNPRMSKKIYFEDVFDLLGQGEPASCIAVYRAILNKGRSKSFAPPSGELVQAMYAEESHLYSLHDRVMRLQPTLIAARKKSR